MAGGDVLLVGCRGRAVGDLQPLFGDLDGEFRGVLG